MTATGTFIINGAERVIVSQLVRSPGAYYDKTIDMSGKNIFTAQVIPNRGAWIELETDSASSIAVRIDRTRKMPVSYFLRALGFVTNEQILELFDVGFFIYSKLHDHIISKQITDFLSSDKDGGSDSRNSLTIGYLRRELGNQGIRELGNQGSRELGNQGIRELENPNNLTTNNLITYSRELGRNEDTFTKLIDAYSQLDSKNDTLSNYKYLLDILAAIDDKNQLTAAYKALADMLDADKKDNKDNKEEALVGIYNRLRPGEPPSPDNAASLLHSQFFDPRRYDLATVGRYKITKKLGWKRRLLGQTLADDLFDAETGELLIPADTTVTKQILDSIPDDRDQQIFNLQPDELRRGFINPIPIRIKTEAGNYTMLCAPTLDIHDNRTICIADIIASINYIFALTSNSGVPDDIDHLGNRRVRAVGELLQNHFRIGMSRMERVVRERMTTQDAEIVTPQNLINIRPVVAAIKEFFFMH